MKLASTLVQRLVLLLHVALALLPNSSFAQSGPGGAGNPYPCVANVNIGAGYQCADNVGTPYPYPLVFSTHVDTSGNTVVDYQSPMAAKQATTLNVTMTVTRPQGANGDYSGTLSVMAEYNFNSVPVSSPTEINNLGPGQSATIEFQIGPLPNGVDKGELVIYFYGDPWL